MQNNTLLSVQNLDIKFKSYLGEVHAVRNITFDVYNNEILAIVGESGCGKSVTARHIMGLNPIRQTRCSTESKIIFKDKNLLELTHKERTEMCGKEISMIFQDPATSFNPVMKIRKQVVESLIVHKLLEKKSLKSNALKSIAISLLKKVHIPSAEERIELFPYQFSGGMLQRALITSAIAISPKLLIADEPTTALDVTIQAQILTLLQEIKKNMSLSILLITHDFGVVSQMADRIIVMYAGEIVEEGTREEVLFSPMHPYTKALLKSLPDPTSHKNQKQLHSIPGTPPDLKHTCNGCAFVDRCELSMKICKQHSPPKFENPNTNANSHFARCWLYHNHKVSQKGDT